MPFCKTSSFLLVLFRLLSCSNREKEGSEYILDTQTDKKIVAFEDAPFTIGITHEDNVKKIADYKNQGITTGFNGLDLLAYVKISSSAYLTAKGIKVGDTKERVQERYGNPYTWLGEIKSPSSDAYIYGNLMFLFDEEDKVRYIILSEIR